MLCGGKKKGIFSVSEGASQALPRKEFLPAEKGNLDGKEGAAPQLQLRIRDIFINLRLSQTKAALRQQPLQEKSCNILHLKPAKKPVGGGVSMNNQFRGSFHVSKRGNDGQELSSNCSFLGGCSELAVPGGNVLAKKKKTGRTTAAWDSTGSPKGEKLCKNAEILQLNMDFQKKTLPKTELGGLLSRILKSEMRMVLFETPTPPLWAGRSWE